MRSWRKHVHNIIVFNNRRAAGRTEFRDGGVVLDASATVTTDSRGSKVFDSDKWDTVKTAIVAARESVSRRSIAAGIGRSEKQRFNIRACEGLDLFRL